MVYGNLPLGLYAPYNTSTRELPGVNGDLISAEHMSMEILQLTGLLSRQATPNLRIPHEREHSLRFIYRTYQASDIRVLNPCIYNDRPNRIHDNNSVVVHCSDSVHKVILHPTILDQLHNHER